MNNRSLQPGTIFHKQRYRIERVLGEGGFGVTYMVTDFKLGKISAMKEYMPMEIAYRRPGSMEVLPTQGNEKPYEQFRDKFLEEARIIHKFEDHPNIISVYHLFYDNNTAYYAMEFIDGMDLCKYQERNGQPLGWDVLKPIVGQVIKALQAVHSSGVIHCDISPDNIFILNGGQVKLIDFGAAKNVLHGHSSMMLLKRGFAPPEQLSASGRIGPWTDIYALAVTIYRAITGRMPPTSEERLTNARTVWPSQLGIPGPFPQWEQVLKKAMSLRVEDRYQSVEEFWAELSRDRAYSQFSQPSYGYSQMGGETILEGLRGTFAGARIPIRQEMLLGTKQPDCAIAYPPGSPGISRVHMRIWPQDGMLMVMDMRSTYGTWLDNRRMTPGLAYVLNPGSTLYLGDNQIFRAVRNQSVQSQCTLY